MAFAVPRCLDKTLLAVQSGLSTTQEIYQADADRENITVLAINRRLERLRELKYLTRKRQPKPSRFFSYSITKSGLKAVQQKGKTPNGR